MNVTTSGITVRSFTESDRPFFQRIVSRLHPGKGAARRDPTAFAAWFQRLASGQLDHPEGAETFVAIDQADQPLGLLMIQPATDYFTGAPRAYVEVLVVAAEAEGQGVGRALMAQAEHWTKERGYTEIALDVFATNTRAIAFYDRAGYAPDHIRMVKAV